MSSQKKRKKGGIEQESLIEKKEKTYVAMDPLVHTKNSEKERERVYMYMYIYCVPVFESKVESPPHPLFSFSSHGNKFKPRARDDDLSSPVTPPQVHQAGCIYKKDVDMWYTVSTLR